MCLAKLFLIRRPAHSVGYRLVFVINEVCSGIVFIDYEAQEKVPFPLSRLTASHDPVFLFYYFILFYLYYMCSYHMSTHAPWAVIMCSYNIMSKSSNFFYQGNV